MNHICTLILLILLALLPALVPDPARADTRPGGDAAQVAASGYSFGEWHQDDALDGYRLLDLAIELLRRQVVRAAALSGGGARLDLPAVRLSLSRKRLRLAFHYRF